MLLRADCGGAAVERRWWWWQARMMDVLALVDLIRTLPAVCEVADRLVLCRFYIRYEVTSHFGSTVNCTSIVAVLLRVLGSILDCATFFI